MTGLLGSGLLFIQQNGVHIRKLWSELIADVTPEEDHIGLNVVYTEICPDTSATSSDWE